MSYEQNVKPWSGMYMQQTTYKHDYNPAGGISPRNRQTNYPYGADAPKADIPGPYNNFRPRYGDPLPQHIRDQLRNYLDGQRFDDQPLTDRQRIKRGEEWIGGRRYDEPMTDRGVYGPPRRQYYERERGRDLSPYRGDDRIYNVLDNGRRTSLDRPINRNRDNEFERQNLRLGRHTSLDRYDLMDKRKENLKQYIQNRRRDPFEGLYQDRGRNGSPERYYDRGRDNGRGRDFDRRRDESPGKFREWDRDRNGYNGYNDRYSRLFRDKFKYLDLYERPAQPMIDSYADHRKMTDRTTYKDYGEFLQEKIKLDELKKQPVEYPAANLPKSTNSGVYLFIRTNKLAKADVVKALQEGRSVLANSYGQLKGIATNREIQLLEGQEGWNIRANMTRTGDYWLERSQDSTVIDDMILVIWFPTFNDAEKWVISERKFKTPSFPEPYGSDVMILPLNDSQPQERIAYTYITTEYPRQLDPVMFRENFVPKIKEVLYKHGNDGFFIQSVGAKVIRGHWVKPSSLITTIRFNTRQDALNFFLDPEYKQIRLEISRRIEQLPVYMNWFKPVSFMFTLDKYV
ncbi:uncharacterized protein LOC128187089 isoform X30 [Crassostrea angulata]|uniref:uncharacterized protein LOC128187089 isoform X30 n=1 Tax=Magallana angulata TaxID=2784310 RepID=UPI0022B19595|nr:uncharacterized protein LOC128187089 isoform X30 [Crassostrea angulata]